MPIKNSPLNRRDFLRTGLFAGLYVLGPGFKFKDQAQVALIGDSIRKGYQGNVSGFMPDDVTIWSPKAQELNTINILQDLKDWLYTGTFEVIYINSGLNDIRTIDYYSNDPVIPIDLYSRNVENIIKMINRYSPASFVVWATTTPVIDEWFEDWQSNFHDFKLKNEDIIRYNEEAKKTVTRLGAAVDDLFGYIMSGDPKLLMKDDGMHFTDYGYKVLGERVYGVIDKIINKM